MITAGRVTIEDEVVTELGTKVVPGEQEVHVDGERVKVAARKYFLLNKPAGVLCTNRDPHGRPRAVDMVEAGDTRLFTVGRLDEHSRGLLIVTNDGDLTQKLAHPSNRVIRKYRLQVAGVPKAETLRQLRQGLHFEEGLFRLNTAKRLKTHGSSATVEVELAQGRNREIRRLFARVGHKVMQLERVQFGPLKLGDLAPGKFRPLTRDEVKALQNLKPEDADRAPRGAGAVGEGEATGQPEAQGLRQGRRDRPRSCGLWPAGREGPRQRPAGRRQAQRPGAAVIPSATTADLPHADAVQTTATVESQQRIARNTFRLSLTCPTIAARIEPGQFSCCVSRAVTTRCWGARSRCTTWGKTACRSRSATWSIGKMTRLMAELSAGDAVEIWGPLGHGFPSRPRWSRRNRPGRR